MHGTPQPDADDVRPPRNYDAAEAAEILGVSKSWLIKQAAARQVPHVRFGNRARFTAEHIAQINAAHEVRPQVRPIGPRRAG